MQVLLSYCRLLLNPEDDIAFLEVAGEWPGIGEWLVGKQHACIRTWVAARERWVGCNFRYLLYTLNKPSCCADEGIHPSWHSLLCLELACAGDKAQKALLELQESLLAKQQQQQRQQPSQQFDQQQRSPCLLECAAQLAAGAGAGWTALGTAQRNAIGRLVALVRVLRQRLYSRGPVEMLDAILHETGVWDRHEKKVRKKQKTAEKYGSPEVGAPLCGGAHSAWRAISVHPPLVNQSVGPSLPACLPASACSPLCNIRHEFALFTLLSAMHTGG